jgi:hypothetical protein
MDICHVYITKGDQYPNEGWRTEAGVKGHLPLSCTLENTHNNNWERKLLTNI